MKYTVKKLSSMYEPEQVFRSKLKSLIPTLDENQNLNYAY